MRMIGSIPNQMLADRFGDYLITLDMDHSLEQNDGDRWDVWIAEDDELDRGKRELNQFLKSPEDAKYNVGKKAQSIRVADEKQSEKRRKNFIDVRTNWAFGSGSYWVTLTLIILCGIVAAVTMVGYNMGAVGQWLYFTEVTNSQQNGLSSPGLSLILHGQIWRLITPMFLHLNPLHFIFNMFWLRDLGSMIETRRGHWVLIGLVLASEIIANFVEYFWWVGIQDTTPALAGGMSGVVYGLFGYAWMKSRFQPHLNIHVSERTVMIMLAWLAICAVGVLGDIANASHVGGLLTGLLIGYAPYGWQRLRRKR